MTRRVWCHGEDRRCDMRTKPIGRKRCQLSKCKEWETGDWYRVSNLCMALSFNVHDFEGFCFRLCWRLPDVMFESILF